MTTYNFCFYLQNRPIQSSQTGGQQYSDTSPFSIPWYRPLESVANISSLGLIFARKAGACSQVLDQAENTPAYLISDEEKKFNKIDTWMTRWELGGRSEQILEQTLLDLSSSLLTLRANNKLACLSGESRCSLAGKTNAHPSEAL
jgi:hypothetical protein